MYTSQDSHEICSNCPLIGLDLLVECPVSLCVAVDYDCVNCSWMPIRGDSPRLVDNTCKECSSIIILTKITAALIYLFKPFRDSELELSNDATVLQSGDARCR